MALIKADINIIISVVFFTVCVVVKRNGTFRIQISEPTKKKILMISINL